MQNNNLALNETVFFPLYRNDTEFVRGVAEQVCSATGHATVRVSPGPGLTHVGGSAAWFRAMTERAIKEGVPVRDGLGLGGLFAEVETNV